MMMKTISRWRARQAEEPVVSPEFAAVERMIDEGGPVHPRSPVALSLYRCAGCGRPKSPRSVRCSRCAGRGRRDAQNLLAPEISAQARAAERRAARTSFRLYCVSCGRSNIVASPPRRPGRCPTCTGTMLTEIETN